MFARSKKPADPKDPVPATATPKRAAAGVAAPPKPAAGPRGSAGAAASAAGPARLTAGQRAYELRRAQEAGMSLDAWLARKHRAGAAAVPAAKPKSKSKGLISRLLDKAHRPL